MQRHPIPNFAIIGAPKCGTTSLAEYLKHHPNVLFSQHKEPFFFADDYDVDYKRGSSLEEHLALCYDHGSPEAEYIAVGEGSTHYLYSECAVPNMLKLNPKAKFIVMLRNPCDMVYSLHTQWISNGYETVSSFSKAWQLSGKRTISKSCREPKLFNYKDMGKLGKHVRRLLSRVPRENVMFLVYDDFSRDTRTAYKQVLEFLELPEIYPKQFGVHNERMALRSKWLFDTRIFLRSVRESLGIRSGLGLGRFLHKRINVTSVKKGPKPMDPRQRAEVSSYFSDDLQDLSDILGRDLSHWQPERTSVTHHSEAHT